MIIKLFGVVALILTFTVALPGKDKSKPFYPVALIDSSLKRDAWAVCRDYRQ